MADTPDQSEDAVRPEDRFLLRSEAVAAFLAHRLEVVVTAHGLSEKRLWASHREMARLRRRAEAPNPTDFWEQSASPAAETFLTEAIRVVDQQRDELYNALCNFAASTGPTADPDGSAPPLVTDSEVANLLAVAWTGISTFVDAASTSRRINGVGAWWQGRLRRAAIAKSAGRLFIAPVGRLNDEVTAAEMRLLGDAPWCHDDRLLSAYELAHTDLHLHVAATKADLNRQAKTLLTSGGCSPRQVPGRRPRGRPIGPLRPVGMGTTIDLS